MKTKLLFAALLFVSSFVYGQEFGVVAGLTPSGNVKVRWFSEVEFNTEGVIVYRREKNQNDWIKLTTEPIKKIEKITSGTDTSLLIASAMLYDISPENQDDKETYKTALLSKAIVDEKFARAYGMEYNDMDVLAGKVYEYKAAAIKNGKEYITAVSEPVRIEKYIQPPAPLKLKGTAKDAAISFSWERDEYKYFVYNLYRGESKSLVKLINKTPIQVFEFPDSSGYMHTSEYFYSDTGLVNGVTYYYELTGIDYLGRESKKSSIISVTPKDLTPPPAPTHIRASQNKNDITITWKAAIVNDLKGFDLYRSREFKGPYEKINKTIINKNDTSYVDKILSPEERYYYCVTAEDLSFNKSQSLSAVVQVQDWEPPAKPVNLKAVGDVGLVQLSWKKGIEKDLLGYFIYRSVTNTEDEFVLLNPKPVNANGYVDTLKKEARNFFQYKIVAVDKKFNLSPYSEIVNVKQKDLTPPPAPILVSAEPTDNVININWINSSVEDAAGFFIYRSDKDDSSKWNQLNKIQLSRNISEYKDSGMVEGNYFYSIIAIDSSGNKSEKSNLVSAKYVDDSPLPAVEGLVQSFDSKSKSVNLSWKNISGRNLLGYIVMRKENEDEEFVLAVSSLQKETTFVDTDFNTGKTYYYLVKAFDEKGNISQSGIGKIEITKTE